MTPGGGRERAGWMRVRFGDVVRLSSERCSDAVAAGIVRYVGLEHLEPGDLRIRVWGNVADGVTFTNRFRPGQVLFGKRRAYQRKVAVAEFDGICSSDIYVFEPADERLLPELLPFICQTDGFFEHALKTSAGSLSPRTNWTSLADYEFDLPPIDEQRRFAALTSACGQLHHELRHLQRVGFVVTQAGIEHLAHAALGCVGKVEARELGAHSGTVPMATLCCCEVVSGTTPRNGRDQKSGVPFVRVQHLSSTGAMTFANSPSYVSREAVESIPKLRVQTDDILMNIVGPPMGKLGVVPSTLNGALINQAIVRFRPRPEDRDFLLAWLRSSTCQAWFLRHSTKTSGQRNINVSTCQQAPVPLPNAELRQIATRLLQHEQAIELSTKSRIASLDRVRNRF